jgi:UDP-2,3-diacylglucosamine hydrolase
MKTYFASDFHLGVDARLTSVEREKQICRWLDSISHDAEAIYLVGDIFDYWFEYKETIPKGFNRLLGKIAELRDKGIEMHFFTGNHDMWMFQYFTKEFDIPIHRKPIVKEIYGKTFFIGHGDGLGPGDYGYKVIKKIFANPICQWLFGWLHPNIGLGLMRYFSTKSRKMQKPIEENFLGVDREWLIQYANRKLDTVFADYFIFGHRHLPIDWLLKNNTSRYLNLGEWFYATTYAVFDGKEISIQVFDNQNINIARNH